MASPFRFTCEVDRPWPLPGFTFPDALAVDPGVDVEEEPIGEPLTWPSGVDVGLEEEG
jgi:hypothetical protein